MCTAIVLSLTTWFSATAIVPELTTLWNLSGSTAAWLTNGVQIGFVVGAVAASMGNLPDLIRLNRLMAISAFAAGLANAVLLIAPSPEAAVVARILTGAALAGVYPPALKLISTWFSKGRGFALGAIIGALTLGSAFPHFFRALSAGVDWRLVVLITSLATWIGAAMFLFIGKEGPFPFSRAIFDPKQIGAVLTNRPLFLANLGYFGHMWELYAMWGWFLTYSREALTVQGIGGAADASFFTFAVIAVGAAGSLLGGVLADRIGRTATTIGMMSVSGACALLIGFAFAGPFWFFVAIALVWGVSVIGDSAQFSAAVTEVSDGRFVGTALALQLGLGFALTVVSIWLTPLVADWLGGWRWTFLILVPGPVIGICAMLALRRRPEAAKIAGGLR
jgi:MFS family permease